MSEVWPHMTTRGYIGQVFELAPILRRMEERGMPIDDVARLKLADEFGGHILRRRFDDRLTAIDYEVEVVNDREQKYEEELAEDIMKILTCYSARYYGARGGRKGNKKALPVGAQLVLDSIEAEPQGE